MFLRSRLAWAQTPAAENHDNPEMPRYVEPTDQLVMEVFVRDIQRSKAFYLELGFELVEDRGEFVDLAWEGHHLYLDERDDLPDLRPGIPTANVRIMVPDV